MMDGLSPIPYRARCSMFIPYSTDAPIYHWPIATVGLIVANVAAYSSLRSAVIMSLEDWMLSFADGIHPEQWLLSIFMHAGWMHLIGNMIFLWLFGLVVEGKLGWWRFLCLLPGDRHGADGTRAIRDARITRATEPGSLGASGAIFGLMAMAMIWAPMNEIDVLIWCGFSSGHGRHQHRGARGTVTGWEVVMICIFGGRPGAVGCT